MKLRRKPGITMFLIVISSFISIAQTSTLQAYKKYSFINSIHDYDAINLNPANIAGNKREGSKFSLGLIQMDVLFNNKTIKDIYLHKEDPPKNSGNGEAQNGNGALIDDILRERTFVNLDLTLLGFDFHTKKAGSFALSLKSNVLLDGEVNGVFEDITYDGSDFNNYIEVISQVITDNLNDQQVDPAVDENSYVRVTVTNEINTGYSHRLIKTKKMQVFGGIGLRYIMGFADAGFEFNTTEAKGYYSLSSLLPDDLDSENIISESQSNRKFGNGMGSSIGTFIKYKDKLRIGLSFTDMGFIKWPSKSIYISESEVINGAQEVLIGEEVNDVVTNLQRKSESMEILPAKMILAANYNIHRYVSFYLDFVSPLNKTSKNLDNPIIGVGTWLSLKHYLTLKTGATVNKDRVTLPVYIAFFAGKNQAFELNLGTSDLISFFMPNREYINANLALMKFHF